MKLFSINKGIFQIVLITLVLLLSTFLPYAIRANANTFTDEDVQKKIDEALANGVETVQLEEGLYIFDNVVKLGSNIHLKGAGVDKTIIEINPKNSDGTSATHKLLSADRKQDVEISDLTVDGKLQDRMDRLNHAYAHSISIAHTKGFNIHNVKIVNSAGAGIMLYNSNTGKVTDSTILNTGANAIIGMLNTYDIDILRNTIGKTHKQNGIFFSYGNGQSSKNILIEGNTVRNVGDYAIEVGHTTQKPEDPPHENITVKNNIIENALCTGVGFRQVSNSTIEGNTIAGYAKHHGYGCNAVFVEGRVSLMENIDITNNKIKQTYPKVEGKTHPYQQAMYLTGVNGMNVTENEIDGSWNQAIYVLASYAPSSTPDFPDARRVYKNVKVEDNTILNSESKHIEFDSYNTSGNTVINNTLTNAGVEPIDINNNSGVTVNGNIIDNNNDELPTEPEEPLVETENEWSLSASFEPLEKWYPSTQKQYIDAGKYRLTFSAKSDTNSVLNVYYNDRRKLNKFIDLNSEYTQYEYIFEVAETNLLVFLDKDTSLDIFVKDIFLERLDSIEIPEEPTEPEKTREEIAVEQLLLIKESNPDAYEYLITTLENGIDIFIK